MKSPENRLYSKGEFFIANLVKVIFCDNPPVQFMYKQHALEGSVLSVWDPIFHIERTRRIRQWHRSSVE